MPDPSPILAPVVTLVAWSMVMWGWLYLTRIPAIINMRMKMDPQRPNGEQMAELPAQVRWKADNYNHLMERNRSLAVTNCILKKIPKYEFHG